MNIGSAPLEWLARIFCVFYLLLSARHCVRDGDYRRKNPGCYFPSYLQSTEPGYGDWTWKYGGATHVGKVNGGKYTICSKDYSKETIGHFEEICPDNQKSRICIKQYGNKFAVQHGEDRPKFQCIEFIVRSRTIIQLALSDIDDNASTICNRNMTVDHSPWISVKHSAQAKVSCPFIGGYNFHEIQEYSKDHQLQRTDCKRSTSTDVKPVLRIESDCVDKEGLRMHFREEKCIPDRSYFTLDQSLVCVASWEMDGHGFAVLKKDKGEFAFYCMRAEFIDGQVSKIVLYLDWECYRATDLSSPDGKVKLGYSTPYVVFTGAEKHVFSIPCRPGVKTCSELVLERKSHRRHPHHHHHHNHQEQQHQLHPLDQGEEETCQHCFNTTGHTCDMNHVVLNTWTIREPHHVLYNLTIHPTSINHPNLGTLQCVTFDPKQQVALRSVVWGIYQNGCYPRFMCMYYDTPFTNILRYRLSNVLQWPVTLSDEEICHEANFVTQPNFYDPRDKYEESPWHIAFAHNSYFRPQICVIPTWLPDSVSFVDHRNRTGCVTFRQSWPAKSISFHHVDRLDNGSYVKFTHGHQHSFYCLTTMSFLSTYKTSITQTKGHSDDFLCWMYIDSQTVVAIRTSSCNKQTADGILRKEEKYLPHLQWLLRLDAADPDVREECHRLHYEQQVRWQDDLNSEVYTPGRREESSRKSSQISLSGHFWVSVLLLCTTTSVFNYVNI